MSQLGSGGFGIVHVWRNSVTGQCYALKKCKLGSDITMTARYFEIIISSTIHICVFAIIVGTKRRG